MTGQKLLILGNGFDLYLGAKTKYGDYFYSKAFENKLLSLKDWVKLNGAEFNAALLFEKAPLISFNIWELILYESTSGEDGIKDLNWCDIEQIIYDFLTKKDSSKETKLYKLYAMVSDYYTNNQLQDPQSAGELYTAWLFLLGLNDKTCFKTFDIYCQSMLVELYRFEHDFGCYIKTQTVDDQNYNKRAMALTSQILSNENRLYIDTFNYSEFSPAAVYIKNNTNSKENQIILDIRHINGNFQTPIFGINALADLLAENKEIVTFTKTSRRMQQDVLGISGVIGRDKSFESVIVFGHSLNMQDYDYFYYIFTMLQFYTLDVRKMGEVIFLFHVFDSEQDMEIKYNYSHAVYNLLEAYENSVSYSKQHVLINLLRFSGKLKIQELKQYISGNNGQ